MESPENLSWPAAVSYTHLCREKEAVAEFDTRNQELTKLNLFVGKLSALLNPVTYVLINIATVILIQKAGVEVNLGGMQQGDVYKRQCQGIVQTCINATHNWVTNHKKSKKAN